MLANLIKLIGPILSFGKGSATDTGAVNGLGAADGFAALLEGTASSDAALLPETGVRPDAAIATPVAQAEAIPTPAMELDATIIVTDDLPADHAPQITFSLPLAPGLTTLPASYRRTVEEVAVELALPTGEADGISIDVSEGATPPAPVDKPVKAAEHMASPYRPAPVPSLAPAATTLPTAAAPVAEAPEVPNHAMAGADSHARLLRLPDAADPDTLAPSMPVASMETVSIPALASDAAGRVPAHAGQSEVPAPSPTDVEPKRLSLLAPGDRPGIAHAMATPVIRNIGALPSAMSSMIGNAPLLSDEAIGSAAENLGEDAPATTLVPADAYTIAVPLIMPVATATAGVTPSPLGAPALERDGPPIAIEAAAGTPAALRRQIEQAFPPVQTMESPVPSTPTAAPSSISAPEVPSPAPVMPTGTAAADPAVAPSLATSPVARATASALPVEAAMPPVEALAPSAATPAGTASVPNQVAPAKIRTWPIGVPGKVVPADSPSLLEPAPTTDASALPVSEPGHPVTAEAAPAPTGPAPAEPGSPPASMGTKAAAQSTPEATPLRASMTTAESTPSPTFGPGEMATTSVSPTEPVKVAAAAIATASRKIALSVLADDVSPPAKREMRAAAAQPAEAAPSTSESVRRALSLLRVAERGDDMRVAARSTAPSDSVTSVAPVADAPVQISSPPASPGQPAPMPAATLATGPIAIPTPLAPAVVLADRIVDIGVSGQWIDRLAQEIAHIAASDGTARFALNPPALGAMHVEIRHGDTGAAIRMLVETEAALNALRDAQPQLKADANLAAVRIADIHIERRTLPAEASSTARDQSQQNPAQSGRDQASRDQLGGSSQNPSTANAGAGQGQTASQPYRKAPLIEATLNGPSGGETSAEEIVAAPRRAGARYA